MEVLANSEDQLIRINYVFSTYRILMCLPTKDYILHVQINYNPLFANKYCSPQSRVIPRYAGIHS
jgi:hypothetical protein